MTRRQAHNLIACQWNKQDHQYWHKLLRYLSYFVLASSQPRWIAHAELVARCATIALSIFLRRFAHICPLLVGITGTRLNVLLLLLLALVTTISELQCNPSSISFPSKKPTSLDATINSVDIHYHHTGCLCKARQLLSYYWRESCRFLVVSLLKRSNRSRDTIQIECCWCLWNDHDKIYSR